MRVSAYGGPVDPAVLQRQEVQGLMRSVRSRFSSSSRPDALVPPMVPPEPLLRAVERAYGLRRW